MSETVSGTSAPRFEAIARAALEAETAPETIGAWVSESQREGEPDIYEVVFEPKMSGYRGWKWVVSIVQSGDSDPSVIEVQLLPGEGALVAPEWVPWSVRLAEWQAQQAALAEAAAAEAAEAAADAEDADGADGAEGPEASDEVDDEDLEDDDDLDDDEDDEDEDDDLDDDEDDVDEYGRVHSGDVDGVDIDDLDDSIPVDVDEVHGEDTDAEAESSDESAGASADAES